MPLLLAAVAVGVPVRPHHELFGDAVLVTRPAHEPGCALHHALALTGMNNSAFDAGHDRSFPSRCLEPEALPAYAGGMAAPAHAGRLSVTSLAALAAKCLC